MSSTNAEILQDIALVAQGIVGRYKCSEPDSIRAKISTFPPKPLSFFLLSKEESTAMDRLQCTLDTLAWPSTSTATPGGSWPATISAKQRITRCLNDSNIPETIREALRARHLNSTGADARACEMKSHVVVLIRHSEALIDSFAAGGTLLTSEFQEDVIEDTASLLDALGRLQNVVNESRDPISANLPGSSEADHGTRLRDLAVETAAIALRQFGDESLVLAKVAEMSESVQQTADGGDAGGEGSRGLHI